MRPSFALSSSLAAIAILGVAWSDGLKSGLQVGDFATPFDVRNVTGRNCAVAYAKDERDTLCYR